MLDIAAICRVDELQRATEAAERRGLLDLRDLERVMAPGQRGARALRAALRDYHDPGFTRSELERRFARLCRDTGIPPPAMNTWIGDQEVDAIWADANVAVQLDGHEYHRRRAAFERDRIRDADLQLAGYCVLRITHRRLTDEPYEVVSAVRSLLARATSSSSATEYSMSSANSSRSAIAS